MILVLFAFVLVLALGGAALRAADAALHTSTDGVAQKQAELLTVSYAETLVKLLENPDSALCVAAEALESGETLAIEGEFTSPDGAFVAEDMAAECVRTEDTLACAIRCARENKEYQLSVRLQLAQLEGGKKAWQLLAYAPVE